MKVDGPQDAPGGEDAGGAGVRPAAPRGLQGEAPALAPAITFSILAIAFLSVGTEKGTITAVLSHAKFNIALSLVKFSTEIVNDSFLEDNFIVFAVVLATILDASHSLGVPQLFVSL